MLEDDIQKIRNLANSDSRIKLVYFFGSRVNGEVGPLSDHDFAIYTETKGKKEAFDLKLAFSVDVSRILNIADVDVVDLRNVTTRNPVLAYDVVANGQLIYESESYSLTFEPAVLNSYFDYRAIMRRHGLTKA